jgi:probable rRNA maturation factor
MIDIQNRRKMPRVPTPYVRKIARLILKGLDLPKAELSILLTDDATIHGLNQQWRQKNKPTDVLSFSQVEGEGLLEGRTLGDLVISLDTAARQAKSARHALGDELKKLMVHGVLHLLGHDHVRGGAQARRMKKEEARLLELLKGV